MLKVAGLPNKRQPRTPGVLARGMSKADYDRWYRSIFGAQLRAHGHEYYEKNKESILKRHRENAKKVSKEKRREYSSRWLSKPGNREKQKAYVAANREAVRAQQREYASARRRTPRGSLDNRMAVHISVCLRGLKSGRKWESLVGYTVADLVDHIESQFTKGMTWEKLVVGEIHIDHKIPKSKFKYSNAEDAEFRRCWALENLQPMWARKNQQKWSKLLEPTQIPLGI